MNRTSASLRLAGVSLAALLSAALTVCATPAFAASDAHEHGHSSTVAKPPAGQRWATDATLREGMSAIRQSLEPKLEAIERDKLTPAAYQAIADVTQQQVARIVANCKLDPQADAALHGILAQMGDATDAMSGKAARTKPREGAVKLARALDEYGRTFDHPGWKRLQA